jgi:hypothetical protein
MQITGDRAFFEIHRPIPVFTNKALANTLASEWRPWLALGDARLALAAHLMRSRERDERVERQGGEPHRSIHLPKREQHDAAIGARRVGLDDQSDDVLQCAAGRGRDLELTLGDAQLGRDRDHAEGRCARDHVEDSRIQCGRMRTILDVHRREKIEKAIPIEITRKSRVWSAASKPLPLRVIRAKEVGARVVRSVA